MRSVHIKKRKKNISLAKKGAGTPYRRVPSQKKTLVLGNFPWQDFSPDISLIFSKIPDISLTAVKFPDISRLTRQVVTLYGSLLLSFEMCSRDGHSTDISKHRISGPQGGPAILITVTQHPYLKYNACRKKLRKFTVFLCSRKRGMVELL